jgi:hypothetical protein
MGNDGHDRLVGSTGHGNHQRAVAPNERAHTRFITTRGEDRHQDEGTQGYSVHDGKMRGSWQARKGEIPG